MTEEEKKRGIPEQCWNPQRLAAFWALPVVPFAIRAWEVLLQHLQIN